MTEFTEPNAIGYTIYCKSECPFCVKAKILLEEEPNVTIVDCDPYLASNREGFLEFIRNEAKKECKIFPMIFYAGEFIGGFKETFKFFDEQNSFK
jgi:glutaredoxin